MNKSSAPSYFCYWGKTEKGTGKYHLLPYHCLDVAAVASAWWDSSPAIKGSFCLNSALKQEQIKAWVIFYIALHDYGKFDVRFQLRARPVWQSLYPNSKEIGSLPSVNECKSYFHGEGGLFWFIQDHEKLYNHNPSDEGLDFLNSIDESVSDQRCAWKPWIEAVTGHHGHIITSEYIPDTSLPPTCDKSLGRIDCNARYEWLHTLEELFLKPAGLSFSEIPPLCSSIFLAGFCSVADWLGSRCDEYNFTFCQEPQDLLSYFQERCEADAIRVLELSGIIGRVRPYVGVSALLDSEKQPRSIQTLVDRLPLKAGLTLVEAPTGSGKTEAALSHAWRLIAANMADSVVFALPTQATANAMLGRLKKIAPLIFKDHPNLLLAHGLARFNKDFIKIRHSVMEDCESEDGWIQCCQWLTESRKRVFLGQIGVCTIDQVLISVLPVRHRFVRGFGVGRSILIIDEVHAYDAYMYGLLEEVLRQQKESGGSAILLSATLSENQRKQLLAAWDSITLEQRGKDTPYPLTIWTDGNTAIPFKLDIEYHPDEIRITIETIRSPDMEPDEALLSRIVSAAKVGAQIGIVCNLVGTAQKLARRLRSMTSLPVDLFHARYCYAHRQEKELSAIEYFGPKGKRSTGRILVATQVVEQSLDLDFDWLITQLCPVDLLFQRLGRLHRHNRSNRPFGCEEPRCTVLLPQGDNYGLHGKIYSNTRVLWRTAEMLLSAPDGEIIFPQAYRAWIEAIYRREAWEDEPPEQTAEFDAFIDNVESVKKYLARQMLERTWGMIPFADTDDAVTAVTRDGEMNLNVIPFCLTPQGKMLMDGTTFESLDEYQQLEALVLNSVGVPETWRYWLADAVDGRHWLEMKFDGGCFRGRSKGVTFRYHKDTGLEKEEDR